MEIIEGPEYHTRELILYWMLPDLVVADMEQLLILLFAYSTSESASSSNKNH